MGSSDINRLPKISIVVPVYKAECFVGKLIESIQAQTFCDWELLLIIDGSPDYSAEICKQYAATDKRIRSIEQENRGAHGARLRGCQETRAPYITFVDADDTLPPYSLQLMYDEIIKGYDIVKAKPCDKMNIVQSVFERQELNSDQFVQGVYLGDLAPYLWGALYRRELFDDYIFQLCIENKLLIGEDWITNLYVGKRVNKVLSLNIGVYYYNDNPNSMMHTVAMSDEYGKRIHNVNLSIIGNDPKWDYMKQLKAVACISDFFSPTRSFSHERYVQLRTFIDKYGVEPLWPYVNKRYLKCFQLEWMYRLYTWCYRKVKSVLKVKKKLID